MRKLMLGVFLLSLQGCSLIEDIFDKPGPDPTPIPSPSQPPGPPRIKGGIDILGLGNTRYDLVKHNEKIVETGKAIQSGLLLDAFINKHDPARWNKFVLWLQTGLTYWVRFHGIDATCDRKNPPTCWSGSILHGYNVARERAEAANPASALSVQACAQAQVAWELCQHIPQSDRQCRYSPLLEHNLRENEARVLLDTVSKCMNPGMKLVDNPANVWAYPKIEPFLRECHEPLTQPGQTIIMPAYCDIISFDGQDARNEDILAWIARYPNVEAWLSWISNNNCRAVNEGGATPPAPPSRTMCPTDDMMEWQAQTLLPQDPRPTVNIAWCPNPPDLENTRLYKNFADDHGTGDGKANFPVVIIPEKLPRIEIFDIGGTIAGYLGYLGPYSGAGGGHRYYARGVSGGTGESSAMMAKKLRSRTGTSWGLMKMGNQCRLYDSLRRDGRFQ